MSDVSFDENPDIARPNSVQRKVSNSPLMKLMYTLKLAKDDAGAQRALIIIAGIALALTVLIWLPMLFSSSSEPTPVTPQAQPVRTQ